MKDGDLENKETVLYVLAVVLAVGFLIGAITHYYAGKNAGYKSCLIEHVVVKK